MTESSCAEVFQSGLRGRELQAEIDARFPGFTCEQCSVSPFSPGPVAATEKVIFLTIHPIHYDQETGVLSPVAFEQLTKNDLSLLRTAIATANEVDAVRSKLLGLGRVPRSIDWCCRVEVTAIRSCLDAKGRTLGVYDTALENSRAHASVFVRKDLLETPGDRLRARQMALAIFEPGLTPLGEIDLSANEQSELNK